jgi:hypothetical protein
MNDLSFLSQEELDTAGPIIYTFNIQLSYVTYLSIYSKEQTMAKRVANQDDNINVLVNIPRGQRTNDEWWPLTQLVRRIKQPVDQAAASQTRVRVRVPHGDHAHDEWWPLPQLIEQIQQPLDPEAPALETRFLVSVPHGNHSHEDWWPLEQLGLRIRS